MKYKTLFRLALKAIGVLLFAQGAADVIRMLGSATFGNPMDYIRYYMSGGGYLFEAGFGLYLFFGGGWIVNLAIPSNRPYCHDCGYDLTGNESGVCPECGAAI